MWTYFHKNVVNFFSPFLKKIRLVTRTTVKPVLDCQVPSKVGILEYMHSLSRIWVNRVRRFRCIHLIKFGKDQPRVEPSDLQILTNARDYWGFYSIIPPSLSLKRPLAKYLPPHPHGFKWFRCCKGEQEKILFLFPCDWCHSFPLSIERGLLLEKITQLLQLV